MKMWIKYALGIVLGLIAAFILPEGFVKVVTEFAVRFGRYMVLPVLFFGASTAIFKLRTTKTLLKTTKWSAITIAGSSFILALLGLVSILVAFKLKIPSENNTNLHFQGVLEYFGLLESDVPGLDKTAGESPIFDYIKSLVMAVLPYSIFENFSVIKAGAYLLPCLIFAGFAGAGCAIDTNASKQVVSLFQSAASVCYSVMCFFVEWFSVALVAVSCMWMSNVFSVENLSTFKMLILILFIDFVLIIGIIYPLILRFVCKDHHPYHVLYAAICPILTGFFSGDANLTMLINMRHGRDSLGIHQPVADVSFPLFSIFARGGSALVTAVSLVVIIRSQVIIDFTLLKIINIFMFSFLLSFVLGAFPKGSAAVCLVGMCFIFGSNYTDKYDLLAPVALILCSFSSAIDAATAMFGSYIVAVKTRMIEHIEVKRYI